MIIENDKEKYDVLKQFILHFLPNTNEKRKYSGNSLESINWGLNKIFEKKLNVSITEEELIDAFSELDYDFMFVIPRWSNLRINKLINFQEHIYDEYKKAKPFANNHAIYISVSSRLMSRLSESIRDIPIFEGYIERTTIPRIELKKEINLFLYGKSTLREEDFKRNKVREI